MADATTSNEQDLHSDAIGPVKVVVFNLAGQRYAFPIEQVQEIQQIVAFSEVPVASAGLVGMVDLRGTVIPALDLRRVLGAPAAEYTLETPMIICRTAQGLAAVIVDEVDDVIELEPEQLQDQLPTPVAAGRISGVARVGEGLVYLLDADAVLGPVISGGR